MKKCNTLEEVRTEIDTIDTKLVEIISERSHLIRQAAGFKNSVEEVKAKDRIERYITEAETQGAKILVDGRGAIVSGQENGFYVGTTVIDNVTPDKKSDLDVFYYWN